MQQQTQKDILYFYCFQLRFLRLLRARHAHAVQCTPGQIRDEITAERNCQCVKSKTAWKWRWT